MNALRWAAGLAAFAIAFLICVAFHAPQLLTLIVCVNAGICIYRAIVRPTWDALRKASSK